MAKDLTGTIEAKIAEAEQRPIILVELYLDAATLRYAAALQNVTFGGTVYTAKAMKFSNIEQSAEGQIGRITVDFDNVMGDMAAYIDDEDFYGKQLIIKRVWADALTTASNYNELLNGSCEEVEDINNQWLTVPVVTGEPLHKKALLNIYQRNCNHLFGDDICNQLGYSNLASLCVEDKAIESGSTDYYIDTVNLSGTTDYWKYGRTELWVKGSGTTYYREVVDFHSGTSKVFLSVPLPISLGATYTYNIYKGCSQTWDCCNAAYAYGPSSGNTPQYGGFIHLSNARSGYG